MKIAQARALLPPDLFAQVQRYAGGQCVYVHAQKHRRTQKKKRIILLRAAGMTHRHIAQILGVSERWVRRVLQQERKT